MIRGIYEDISHNSKNVNLEKVRLFFNMKEHSCDTIRYMPRSVFNEYLKMHMREEITQDDVRKLIEIDYKNTTHDGGGLSTNVFDYLSFYIDVKNLKRPDFIRYESDRNRDHDFTILVDYSMSQIFNTREGKIFLLTGASKTEKL